MSKDYPLYPELTEQGKIEAQRIMDSFKPKLSKLMDEVMGDLYADVSYYVESDHWSNYRNELMDGFKGYKKGRNAYPYDFKELRQAIYENNKEEIVKDLNQDLLKEIEDLEKENERLRDAIRTIN